MRALPTLLAALVTAALVPGCAGTDADVEDGAGDAFLGKDDSVVDGSDAAAAILALVNDRGVDFDELDQDAGLSSRVARNIIAHRDGADGVPATADDDGYDDLAELDAIPYVGPATIAQLLAYATEQGLLAAGPTLDVVFSPQPAGLTHTAKIAELIRRAEHSIDIAMYSYSDAGVGAALEDAIRRGIAVRFLFDTASEDRKVVDLAARTATKSGKLEKAGVDVRWVNKILHHKFILIDGPRDDADRAATGTLVTGSANWSNGGATIYDENTLFIAGSAELNTAYQREFDYLWTHSRDFALATPLPPLFATAELAPHDDAGLAAHFTSANFKVTGDTFSLDWTRRTVSDQLVAAIDTARTSIHIAEGHLRLRAVAEALIARKQAAPALDIKVHLDQQEYISASGDAAQRAEVTACLAVAGADPRKIYDCTSKDFLFAKALIDAGIDVRFKAFAYRWDASYAAQMHSKYLVIDGTDLYTGSYNLSTNSEQATFENVVHVSGTQHAALIARYEANFTGMRELGRADNALAALRTTIATAASIPLVFPPLALTYTELTDLKALIRANCPAVDSTDYRTNPAGHKFCPRP